MNLHLFETLLLPLLDGFEQSESTFQLQVFLNHNRYTFQRSDSTRQDKI
jgi:hypothetical protein